MNLLEPENLGCVVKLRNGLRGLITRVNEPEGSREGSVMIAVEGWSFTERVRPNGRYYQKDITSGFDVIKLAKPREKT